MKKTLIFSMAAVMFAMSVNAATVAYWRFEDGTNGIENATYLDTSGNDSTMDVNGAEGTSDVPWANVPQTLQANTLAASFVPTGADAGDYLRTSGSEYIDTLDLLNWTIEATFMYNNLTNYDALGARPGLVCKEGNLGVNGYPYFKVQVDAPSGYLQVITARDGGAFRTINTTTVIETGKWYSVAVTYEGSAEGADREAELYLKAEGETTYTRLGGTSGPWSGVMLNGDLPWSIGRGFRNGLGLGYVDGIIDEVRISDEVLADTAFLGVVPEPSLVIGGIALALLAFRRK